MKKELEKNNLSNIIKTYINKILEIIKKNIRLKI